MKHRPLNPDPRLAAIAERLACDLAARLEAEGLPLAREAYRDAESHLELAFGRLLDARAKAFVERQRAEQDTWARAEGLVSRQALMQRLMLIEPEVATAERLGLLRDAPLPACLTDDGVAGGHHRYYHPVELSAEQRARIDRETLLTRMQAAAYLQITPLQFDRLRGERGIRHAAKQVGYSGWPSYLYRLADIRQLVRSGCRQVEAAETGQPVL